MLSASEVSRWLGSRPVDQSLIELGVLAFLAGFVLFRLYTTLGKRTGGEPQPQPAQGELPRDEAGPFSRSSPAPKGPLAEGLMAIARADPKFDVGQFTAGARGAYEIIVGAFSKGDREALRNLLTPRVFDSYIVAIEAREAKGEVGPEIVRLRGAEVVDAAFVDNIARLSVKFEAELAEGAVGVRDAREKWTFERDVRSADPNWRLARVTAA